MAFIVTPIAGRADSLLAGLSEDQIQQSYRHSRRSCPTATVYGFRKSPPWMTSRPAGVRGRSVTQVFVLDRIASRLK